MYDTIVKPQHTDPNGENYQAPPKPILKDSSEARALGWYQDPSGNIVNTKTGLVDRYAKEKTAINTNPALNIPEPSYDQIRASRRAQAQGLIDVIKNQFDKYIQEDTEAKNRLESKTYLSGLARGMSGSISGASEVHKAAVTGNKKIEQDRADMETAIAKAIADSDLRASQEFETRRKEWLAASADKLAEEQKLNGNIKLNAEAELGTYAKTMTYDEWAKRVGQGKVDQYMKETGMDEEGLRNTFLKGAKDNLVDTNGTKLSDGSVVFLKKIYDNNGNIIGTKEVGRIKGSNGKTIKESRITDNGVQILYTDGSYEERGNPGNQTLPKGVPKGFSVDDIAKGRSIFENSGHDGYANPGLYVAAYKTFTDNGGTIDAFTKLYPPEEFVNPAETDLFPTFLQPKTTKKTTSSTVTPAPASTTTTSSGRSY